MARIYLQDRQVAPQAGVYVPKQRTYLKDRTASGVPMVKPQTKTQLAQQAAVTKRKEKNLANANATAGYYKQQADQAGSFMGLAKNTITGIPQAIGTLGKEAITHPINTARSVASGVYEGGIKPLAKLPTYLAGSRGAQARQGLDMIGQDLAGNQNQTQQDIRSGFKFAGAVAPYEVAGSVASRLLPNAQKLAGLAGYVGGGQIAYEGANNVQDRAKQAGLDALLFGLTKVAGKGLSKLKQPIQDAATYAVPTEIPKVTPKVVQPIARKTPAQPKPEPVNPLLQEARKYKSNDIQRWRNDTFWGKAIRPDAVETTVPTGEIGVGKRIGIRQDRVTEKGVKEWMDKIKAGERPAVLVGNRSMGDFEVTVKDGNHTLEAYRRLGATEIPIIDNTGGRISDLWKQANQSAPEQSLLNEARKYKSAEEFARSKYDYYGETKLNDAEKKILEKYQLSPSSSREDFNKAITAERNRLSDKYGTVAPDGGVKNDLGLLEQARNKSRFNQLTDLWKQAQGGVSSSSSVPKLPVSEVAKTPLGQVSPKTAEVSQKVGQDVSLPRIVGQSGTDVKSKVNIIDALRTPDRVLKKIGLEKESNLIRIQHEKYLTELPKQIEKIDTWAKQLTPESNQKVFRFLDGENISLNSQETKIAGEIKTYLKDWADRLGLPEDKRITNYITHIFDKDLIKKEFPDELAKIIDNKVAGSVYDPFTLKRLGKLGYIPDTIRALDAYAKRATRKVHMDVALEQMAKASKNLEISQFKYVKQYIDRVNLRPTEIDNAVDNTIKSVIGYNFGSRPTAVLTQRARQWIYRGALGLNPASALKNLSQGANTYAKLGERYTIKGYADLIKNWRSGELEKVGVLQDNFIQDRTLSAGKKLLQKFDDGLMVFFQGAEKINRGAAYYGAKAKGLHEGLSESQSIEYAKKIVRDTQFTFGSIDTPPILQSDIGKTLGQFQSFSIKQGEFLGEMVAAKDIAGLLRYALASTAYITAIGSAFGMKPSDAIPSFRFGVPPTLGFPVQVAKTLLGAPNQYGAPTGSKEIIRAGIPLIPAGVQLNKTIGGLQSYNQGMVTNSAGNAQYPIEQNIQNFIRSLLFGKYNTPEARQYFNNNDRPLSPQQTMLLRELGPEYYKKLMQQRDQNAEKAKIKKYQKSLTPFYTK